MNKMRSQKGIAMVLALIVVAVLSVFGSATIARTVSENNLLTRQLQSGQAFWLAEAGMQKAVCAVNTGDWTGWSTAGTTRTISESLGTVGAYAVTITNVGSTNPTIIVNGNANNSVRTIEGRLSRQTQSMFTYAAFGNDFVRITGNALVDSYNSTSGYYSSHNMTRNGDIATNANTTGAITLSGNARVYGDAGTGPTGTVVVSPNSRIAGAITHDRNESFASVVVPSNLTSLASRGSYSVSGNGSQIMQAGEYKYSSLNISGNGKITINGTVKLYLTSSSALTVSGNGKIIVPFSSELIIYIDGKCSIGGNGFVNHENHPNKLLLYSTYAGSNGISLQGNSILRGGIYAPDTNISTNGNSYIYGSLIGKSVNLYGNTWLHFDENLQNLGGTSSRYSVLSWKDQDNPFPL